MKKLLSIITCSLALQAYSQAGGVGIDTENPNEKAILEVYSKKAGVLFPRLTTQERNSITTSATTNGLLIYNTDEKCFNFYRASINQWEKMCGTAQSTTSKITNKNANK